MANEFKATDDLAASLKVVDAVAATLIPTTSPTLPNPQINNAISCAAVVLMSGYFESFLKDIVLEFINQLNSLNKPLTDIPYEMRLKHFSAGSDALKWAVKQDKKQASTANSEDMMKRLASFGNPAGYELVWEAFADTKSNPGPDVVKDILKGVGAEHSWDEVNKLITSHGQLNVFLETFIGIRNICAHTGQHSSPPTGQMLIEYSEKLRIISECIDVLLRIRLEHFN